MATSAWIAAQYWVCNGAKLCIAFAHAYVVCPRYCHESVDKVDRPFARDARSRESYFRMSASPSSPRNEASSSRSKCDSCCRSRPSSRSRAARWPTRGAKCSGRLSIMRWKSTRECWKRTGWRREWETPLRERNGAPMGVLFDFLKIGLYLKPVP